MARTKRQLFVPRKNCIFAVREKSKDFSQPQLICVKKQISDANFSVLFNTYFKGSAKILEDFCETMKILRFSLREKSKDFSQSEKSKGFFWKFFT